MNVLSKNTVCLNFATCWIAKGNKWKKENAKKLTKMKRYKKNWKNFIKISSWNVWINNIFNFILIMGFFSIFDSLKWLFEAIRNLNRN